MTYDNLDGTWKHGIGNSLILVLALVNVVVRLGHPQGAVPPWGITLTLSAAAIFAYTGWLAGNCLASI